jgi:RHS repeat-associated protein
VQENTERRLEWDESDRMRVFRIQPDGAPPSIYAQYLYDSSGQRVMKLVRDQSSDYETTVYIDGVFELQRMVSVSRTFTIQNNSLHVMDNQKRVAIVRVGTAFPDDTAPAIRYQFGDHLGSTNVVIDDTGAWVSREEYLPYGETSFGSFARKRYRFTGKEKDVESGLYYHGARYYAVWLARWTNPDPAGAVGGLNLFQMARANPMRLVDPSGKAPVGDSPAPSPLDFEGMGTIRQVNLSAVSKKPEPADKTEKMGAEASLRGIAFGVSDLVVGAITAPLGLDEEGNFSLQSALMENPVFNSVAPILGVIALAKDWAGGTKELASGNNDEDASRRLARAIIVTGLLASAAGEGLRSAVSVDVGPAIIQGASEGVAPPEFEIPEPSSEPVAPGVAVPKPPHGNSLNSPKAAFLYRLIDDTGFQKHGITDDIVRRQSQYRRIPSFLSPYLEVIDSGSRADMEWQERILNEVDPGPACKERWAGKKI